jgi:hypothetical protein
MWNKYGVFCILMIFSLLLSCKGEDVHKGRTPVACIGDSYLYKDEVELMFAIYGNGVDSVRFVKNYVERWAVEHLFYNKATENIASTVDVESMVDKYRRGLILSMYQDGLVSQQLLSDISMTDIEDFYNENGTMFEVDEPIFKGLLLKVSDKSPNIGRVRSWCVRRNVDDLESIEKYSLVNEAFYNSFLEEWRPVSDIAKQTPLTEYQLNERLKKRETIEFKHGGYTYFVCADSMIQQGGIKPLEMVEHEVKELLVNSKRADFIKNKKRSLYDDALKSGEIIIF